MSFILPNFHSFDTVYTVRVFSLKKVPGGCIRVAGTLLWCGGEPPATGGVWGGLPQEIFKICIPGDAFWCIFSDKKCFLVGTVHLNNLTLSLPRLSKTKSQETFQISFCKILKDK